MKQLESLSEFQNAVKQWEHPVLENYASDILTGLSFLDKVFSFGSSVIFSIINIMFFLFIILVEIRILLLSWP